MSTILLTIIALLPHPFLIVIYTVFAVNHIKDEDFGYGALIEFVLVLGVIVFSALTVLKLAGIV